MRFTLYLDSNKSSGEGKFSVNGSHQGNYNFSRLWPDDIVSHNAKYKTDEDIKNDEKELALIVNDVKKTCGILGFEPGSEKFADCTLKLYTQKIDEKIAAKQEANNRSLQTSSTTTQSSSGTNTTIIYDPVRDKQNKIDYPLLKEACTFSLKNTNKVDVSIIIPVMNREEFHQPLVDHLNVAINKFPTKTFSITFIEHADEPKHEDKCNKNNIDQNSNKN